MSGESISNMINGTEAPAVSQLKDYQLRYSVDDLLTVLFLSCFFALGAPLNLSIFIELFQRFAYLSCLERVKFQLIIGDMLVIFVYAVTKVCHHLTLYWNGGLLLCKLVKFGQELSFQFSSAILACIGIDRLMTVIVPFASISDKKRRISVLIWGAWGYAIFCSSFQLLRFTTFPVPGTGRSQCTTWQVIWKHTGQMTPLCKTITNAGNVLHLLTIFWLPFLAMCICYAVIGWQVWKHSRQPIEGIRRINAISYEISDEDEDGENMLETHRATVVQNPGVQGHSVDGAQTGNTDVVFNIRHDEVR